MDVYPSMIIIAKNANKMEDLVQLRHISTLGQLVMQFELCYL